MKHDQTNDALIEKLIDDPDMGDWEGEEGQRTYVPNLCFLRQGLSRCSWPPTSPTTATARPSSDCSVA